MAWANWHRLLRSAQSHPLSALCLERRHSIPVDCRNLGYTSSSPNILMPSERKNSRKRS